jgi:enterobactin synthetase component D
MTDARAHPISDTILSPGDINFQPKDMPFATFLTLVFSAKEAFYKSISHELDRILNFQDVCLSHWNSGTMRVQFEGETNPVAWVVQGHDCITLAARLRA